MPLWLAGVLIVIGPTLLAMAGTVFVRSRVGLESLRCNNEVAGFKFATIGVLYAVLLGFAVIVVWARFSAVADNVAREAGAAATLYRLSDGIQDEPGSTLRDRLTAYLKSAISQDWPALSEGRASAATSRALTEIYSAALTYKPADSREALLMEGISVSSTTWGPHGASESPSPLALCRAFCGSCCSAARSSRSVSRSSSAPEASRHRRR